MMAQWRLDGLLDRLPSLAVPTLLLTGSGDRTVPPRVSRLAAALMPRAALIEMPGLGHLAHEEAADAVAREMTLWLKRLPDPA